ncbi:DnaJ-domain-containing protein [Parathielavia appendiculata]|uniref:DnaJ-domain-containing protein n=1 Tax=Parathielavia appendiculata TaxID=2587402 RepID=A0AAN6U9N2_9PEZI|nr:DnaJ-domain-containing protein [Parathielavia appendiculata]
MASEPGRPPNYYAILEVPETASTTQIRDAYKRAALKTHPDRVPTDHPDRASRTRKFQLVNDAYYTLSDPTRRRDYDAQRNLYSRTSGGGGTSQQMPGGFGGFPSGGDPFAEAEAGAGTGGRTGAGGGIPFSWAWNFFTGGGQEQHQQGQERERTENEQFADVFEEMLREEGMADQGPGARPTGKFWSVVGGLSGGALGFIVANVPGLVAGAVAGNRLGAVRDAKGKSVYAVFQELPQADRARLLSQLAAKVLSQAVGV